MVLKKYETLQNSRSWGGYLGGFDQLQQERALPLAASGILCFPVSSGGLSSADISAPVTFLPELLLSITMPTMYFSRYFGQKESRIPLATGLIRYTADPVSFSAVSFLPLLPGRF